MLGSQLMAKAFHARISRPVQGSRLERVSLTGAGVASCLAPLADADLQCATAKLRADRARRPNLFALWLQEIVQFDRPAATKTGSGR